MLKLRLSQISLVIPYFDVE